MKRSKLLTIPRAATRMLLAILLLTMTAQTAGATDKTLSGSESYTAQDGDVLTGSTSGTVTIAADAKITLSGVTITGGIVCEGSATITLAGTNSVTGAYLKAGIQIGGSGTTLTIKGDGSLTANGGSQSAGIGLSRAWDVDATGGDIVIEGGNITATGNDYGAGIGTGVSWGNTSDKTATIGNITIKGGTVRAIGGTNQFTPGSGIGKGGAYSYGHAVVGTITIYDDIDLVDASSISESVTYMHDETDVTANASNYFTITEDGNRRIIVPKDDTDYTITIANDIEHGTLTGAATAKYMEKVTITATPDLGYRLIRLVVKDADNNDVATTGNTFLMPKGDVTVSAVFEQGTHGTTEFVLGYFAQDGYEKEATIYDGVTTVNLQSGIPYSIGKDYYEFVHGEDHIGGTESSFLLDNNIYSVDIPYAGGTGEFVEVSDTKFNLNSESGFYDITMTDVGNGKWSVSILKTVGVIDNIPDQTYTGSEITPEPLVLAGSLSLNKGTDYEYSYTNNINVGTAKVTVTFKGDYASLGSVEKEFTIIAKETNLGAVTIAQDQNGTTATIDASLEATIEITLDIEVSQVELQRSFTENQPATVMLPFSLADGQTVSGGSFYKFSGVIKDGDVWKAQFTEVATLKANTPYLFMPSATGQMTFNLNGGTVTLNTTTTGEAGSTASNWEFRGTYEKVQWDGSASDPSDLSKTYGFAKGNATIAAGQFVHFAAGAWLKPMRCYLVYNGSTEGGTFQNARSRTRGAASTEELPQTITVVLLSSSGETTAIGTLDTKTGDITLDGWYTMDGRKLEGKPTKKGLYINNGRKIVIK